MTTRPVTGTYSDPAGTPLTGRVVFQLVTVTSDGETIYGTNAVAALLDQNGHIAVELVCTDALDVNGICYRVTEHLNGQPISRYYIELPAAPDALDLADADRGTDAPRLYWPPGGAGSGVTDAELAAHNDGTTGVHGIADTSQLLTEAAANATYASLINVRGHGATGDGVTDDTVAVQAALDAVPVAGGAVFFPAGAYKITGVTATRLTHLMGAGGGNVGVASSGGSAASTGVTRLLCDSATATALTIAAHGSAVTGMAIINTHAGPSAGAGVHVTAGNNVRLLDLDIKGFYDCLDIEDGSGWRARGLTITEPVRYGARIRHVGDYDQGDWTIADSILLAGTRSADAAIRIESGGGGKISNTKVNAVNTTDGQPKFGYGIHLHPGSGVNTGQLMVVNSSIENFATSGFRVDGATGAYWRWIMFSNVQFGCYVGDAGPGINIAPANTGVIQDVYLHNCNLVSDSTAQPAINVENVYKLQVIGGYAGGYAKHLTYTNCQQVDPVLPVRTAYATNTGGGNRTITTPTSFTDVSGTPLNIPANAGDLIEVTVSLALISQADTNYFVAFAVNGVVAANTQTPWTPKATGVIAPITLKRCFTAQSGDISSGVIPLKIQVKAASGNVVVVSDNTCRITMEARNLGQSPPFTVLGA